MWIALVVRVRALGAKVFLEWMSGICVFLFGVVTTMGEVVLSRLLVNLVVVAGGRFLGRGRVGDVDRSIADVFCCEAVLLGKRVIV